MSNDKRNPLNAVPNVPKIQRPTSLKRCEKKMSTMYGSELVKPFKSGEFKCLSKCELSLNNDYIRKEKSTY